MELLIKHYHNCLTNESINQSTENSENCFPAIKTINGSACSRTHKSIINYLTECFLSGYPTLKSYNFIEKIQMTISVLKRCLVFKTLFTLTQEIRNLNYFCIQCVNVQEFYSFKIFSKLQQLHPNCK